MQFLGRLALGLGNVDRGANTERLAIHWLSLPSRHI